MHENIFKRLNTISDNSIENSFNMDASKTDNSFQGKRINADRRLLHMRRLRTVVMTLFLVTFVIFVYGIDFKPSSLLKQTSLNINVSVSLIKTHYPLDPR